MRKKICMLFIFLLAFTLLAGCKPQTLPAPGGPAVDLPAPAEGGDEGTEQGCETQYGVSGEILSVEPSDQEGILGVIEVKGELDSGAMYDYARVTVTPDTEITADAPAAFADLKAGLYVHVSFDGPVDESYPVQGTAARIIIEAPLAE
jgi:hypothetical protein